MPLETRNGYIKNGKKKTSKETFKNIYCTAAAAAAAAAAKSLQFVSDSVRPHRRQPTRPHRPWDSPGKNTGVGCHFFLQCMKVKSESEVAQSYPTLNDLMDCSLPGFSVHRIFQAKVLEWGAIAFSDRLATPSIFCSCSNTFSFRTLNFSSVFLFASIPMAFLSSFS